MRAEVDGALLTVTLARPERLNAQDPAMWQALLECSRQVTAEVRVVVVRGTGRAFSAGLDRAAFAPGPDGGLPSVVALAAGSLDEASRTVADYQRAFGWLADPGVVSIAAVQGHAIGAGLQLALACDLRILAEDAQLTMAETGLGLVPDLGGTKRLVELVGYSYAADMCFTGRRVGAEEAHRIGLASSVVPLERLPAVVDEVAAAVCTAPRDAVIETKALLLAAASRSQAEQERAEREAQYRRLRDLGGLDRES